MKSSLQTDWYSVKQCNENPDKLYIFGDNTIGKGCGGQAQIRYCENSFGIPTKIFPTMLEEAFFTDDEEPKYVIDSALEKLKVIIESNKFNEVIFPADGLGTGLAQFDVRCPVAFDYMNEQINKLFNQKIYEVIK